MPIAMTCTRTIDACFFFLIFLFPFQNIFIFRSVAPSQCFLCKMSSLCFQICQIKRYVITNLKVLIFFSDFTFFLRLYNKLISAKIKLVTRKKIKKCLEVIILLSICSNSHYNFRRRGSISPHKNARKRTSVLTKMLERGPQSSQKSQKEDLCPHFTSLIQAKVYTLKQVFVFFFPGPNYN